MVLKSLKTEVEVLESSLQRQPYFRKRERFAGDIDHKFFSVSHFESEEDFGPGNLFAQVSVSLWV